MCLIKKNAQTLLIRAGQHLTTDVNDDIKLPRKQTKKVSRFSLPFLPFTSRNENEKKFSTNRKSAVSNINSAES